MIFHAEIAITVVITARATSGTNDKQRRALLSATVTSGTLPSNERSEQPINQFGALDFLRIFVGLCHGRENGFASKQIALHCKMESNPLASPRHALGPRMSGGATSSINAANLPDFAARISRKQSIECFAGRFAVFQ